MRCGGAAQTIRHKESKKIRYLMTNKNDVIVTTRGGQVRPGARPPRLCRGQRGRPLTERWLVPVCVWRRAPTTRRAASFRVYIFSGQRAYLSVATTYKGPSGPPPPPATARVRAVASCR